MSMDLPYMPGNELGMVAVAEVGKLSLAPLIDSAQNHDRHATADERRNWFTQKYDDVPGVRSAINASTRLLEHYKDGASFAKVEHYLRKSVYALEPVSGVLPAGGSKSVYAK